MPVGPASEPCLIRVVAYRPHQVRPAGPKARDDHNSDTSGRNQGKLSVRKIWALSNTAGDKEVSKNFFGLLEQFVLLGEHLIELRLDQ